MRPLDRFAYHDIAEHLWAIVHTVEAVGVEVDSCGENNDEPMGKVAKRSTCISASRWIGSRLIQSQVQLFTPIANRQAGHNSCKKAPH